MAEDSHGAQPGGPPAANPASPQGVREELTDASPRARSRPAWLRKRVLGTVFCVLLIAVGTPYGMQLWQYYQTHETTDDAYVIGDIVPISARVSGTVVAVHAAKHQQVESGQLLAELDPDDFAARVAQAEAVVAVAKARLRHAELQVQLTQDSTSNDTIRTGATLQAARSALREAQHNAEKAQAHLRTWEAAVAAAQADVDAHDVRVAMAQTGFDRVENLLNDGVVAQQQFDQANSALEAAKAEKRAKKEHLKQTREELEAARADLLLKQETVQGEAHMVAEAQALLEGSQAQHQNVAIQEAEVKVAQALLLQAEADLAYARLQLEYTTLKAPVAGVIAKKNLEVGQVVQTGPAAAGAGAGTGRVGGSQFQGDPVAVHAPPDSAPPCTWTPTPTRCSPAPWRASAPARARSSACCRPKTPPATSSRWCSACRSRSASSRRHPPALPCVRACRLSQRSTPSKRQRTERRSTRPPLFPHRQASSSS